VASVCVAGLPCTMLFVARVAQGIEHRSPKAGVVSSNLIPGTFSSHPRVRTLICDPVGLCGAWIWSVDA
jgi:hypothetical protein